MVMHLEFPDRIYTLEEFKKARELIEDGYKHEIIVEGSSSFKKSVRRILTLIRKAGYTDFLRTYIRAITEIDGVSQLREIEATIWLNTNMVTDTVEGSRFIIQKAEQMKNYLAGERHYESGELSAIKKSLGFLQDLKKKKLSEELQKSCDEAIRSWTKDTIL
jgi:hypothetical protein